MPYKDPEKRKAYHAAYHRQWRKDSKNQERLRVKARLRATAEPEAHRQRFRTWYYERGGKEHQSQRTQDRTKERHRRLARKYGITPEAYEAMWAAQEGKCLICVTPEEEVRGKRLCVDHDHKTGKVRGLLCHRCNCVLGYSMENINTLLASIVYLRNGSGA
jgi:hypothetical protein